MGLLLLIVCLLIGGSVAIDFTTIGQKEIVDYIKNRADLIHGKKLSERNLQDLLSNAVFTGLEEEAMLFAYGSSSDESDLSLDQLTSRLAVLASSADATDAAPLKIILTSDTLGTTNIALSGLTTTKSSSSKSSVGEFVVNSVQDQSSDSTSLDGSITINLGGTTNSHNLTLAKTIYLAAEVNVTSLGADWEPSASQLTDEGKLISMLSSKEGSLYVVTYQSLIRETIKTNEDNLFGGLKSDGKVLVVVGANGVVSLSGRTISGKIEATWEKEAEEHVDTFLTLNGSKSRNITIEMPQSIPKDIVKNWLNSPLGKKSLSIHFGRHRREWRRHRHGHSRQDHGFRYESHLSNWSPSSSDGSTWPSWKPFWEFGWGYRLGWKVWDSLKDLFEFDDEPSRYEPSPSDTQIPEKMEEKPKTTTTPKPVVTVKTVATIKPDKVEATTVSIQTTPVQQPEEKLDLSEPALPNLPKGTSVSIWSSRII